MTALRFIAAFPFRAFAAISAAVGVALLIVSLFLVVAAEGIAE